MYIYEYTSIQAHVYIFIRNKKKHRKTGNDLRHKRTKNNEIEKQINRTGIYHSIIFSAV